MSFERGEIKNKTLLCMAFLLVKWFTDLKTAEGLIEWGQKTINGEKARIKKGGRPIYNPTIGMVSTHFDIFKEAFEQLKSLQERTRKAQESIQNLRPEVDDVLLDLWNQIENIMRTNRQRFVF